ncbi:MAG: SIS domain-containing protein [Gallionellaceae bacterium]
MGLIANSIAVKQALLANASLISQISRIASSIIEALSRGNKVMFCGNGGSFADSIHLATEFVSRFQKERSPMPSIALGANNSILTAIGNDYSFEEIFSREVSALGQAGDVLIAISTSGNSENILRAVSCAKGIGIQVFGMTGESGGHLAEVTESMKIPSHNTARIQESHILAGHIICELAENAMTDG